MNITKNLFVREVVKQNFKTAPIFQASNIDFCCGGNKSISEACKDAGIDSELLINQLGSVLVQEDPEYAEMDNLTLSELSEYIIKRHHSYVKNSIPFLKKNLEKLCQVHGENHLELLEIKELFTISAGEFTMHMQKEELTLFPYIQRLEKAKRKNTPVPVAHFGSVVHPVSRMMNEHQAESERFEKISELSGKYSLPDDACTTYEVTFKALHDFECDLHRHIHLENDILFPKAIELEHK
jgi:iron-sulfur cluster repair di-iron protein